jgi:hypothetical protein
MGMEYLRWLFGSGCGNQSTESSRGIMRSKSFQSGIGSAENIRQACEAAAEQSLPP